MSLHILLVEDDEVDVRSVRRVLEGCAAGHELAVAATAEAALAQLSRDAFSDTPLPDLVLLDLNTPRLSGLEFLHAVRGDPALRWIPVVIVTTSNAERDVRAGYAAGAAGFVVKPLDHAAFAASLRAVFAYWSTCRRPRREEVVHECRS